MTFLYGMKVDDDSRVSTVLIGKGNILRLHCRRRVDHRGRSVMRVGCEHDGFRRCVCKVIYITTQPAPGEAAKRRISQDFTMIACIEDAMGMGWGWNGTYP